MIKTIEIPANTPIESAAELLKTEVSKLEDFGIKFQDGNIIILHQFHLTSYNYVLHLGKWRLIGEY